MKKFFLILLLSVVLGGCAGRNYDPETRDTVLVDPHPSDYADPHPSIFLYELHDYDHIHREPYGDGSKEGGRP